MKKKATKEHEHIENRMKKLEYWIESSADIISHRSSIGTDTELIVRDLIKEYIPDKFGVESGFVRSQEDLNWQSKQIDIILTNKNQGFPLATLLSCKVFPLEAVLGIMEVTKFLDKKKIKEDFIKVSDLLTKHKRITTMVVEDYIRRLKEELVHVEEGSKEQLRINEILHNMNQFPAPRNNRIKYKYGDMPPRFFYFAINSIKDKKILLQHIKSYAEEYNIKLHGMFILNHRMFVSNVGSFQYLSDQHQAFPYFISQIIDSLMTYGEIPGVIPLDSYFGIDRNKIELF